MRPPFQQNITFGGVPLPGAGSGSMTYTNPVFIPQPTSNNVTVFVFDTAGKPIRGAEVLFSYNGTQKSAITDISGKAIFNQIVQNYEIQYGRGASANVTAQLTISAAGKNPHVQSIKLAGWVNVQLAPNDTQMQLRGQANAGYNITLSALTTGSGSGNAANNTTQPGGPGNGISAIAGGSWAWVIGIFLIILFLSLNY